VHWPISEPSARSHLTNMSPSIIDRSLSYTWTNKDKISFKRIGEEVKALWSMTPPPLLEASFHEAYARLLVRACRLVLSPHNSVNEHILIILSLIPQFIIIFLLTFARPSFADLPLGERTALLIEADMVVLDLTVGSPTSHVWLLALMDLMACLATQLAEIEGPLCHLVMCEAHPLCCCPPSPSACV
jgi:hypothetical protein